LDISSIFLQPNWSNIIHYNWPKTKTIKTNQAILAQVSKTITPKSTSVFQI